MMTRPHIIHLIDDTTAGGVMRLLDYIRTAPDLARDARHSIRPIRRGALSMRRIEADVIVSHLSVSWRSLPALISLRAMHPDTPLIHVEHSYTQSFTALNVPNRGRFKTLLRIAYALFDHLIAVSEAQARWMFRNQLADLGKLTVIPPLVDLSGFAALSAPQGPVRRIGAIGRLDPQKGFDLLIPAFRTLPDPDLRLILFGDGPERAHLETLAKGDARIRFAGHAPNPETAMASVDAVVLPSRWEAYGLVALEARTAGRPVLVSTVDGLKDQAQEGAVAVQNPTVAGWTAALRSLAEGRYPPCPRPIPAHRAERFAAGWRAVLSEVQNADTPALIPA